MFKDTYEDEISSAFGFAKKAREATGAVFPVLLIETPAADLTIPIVGGLKDRYSVLDIAAKALKDKFPLAIMSLSETEAEVDKSITLPKDFISAGAVLLTVIGALGVKGFVMPFTTRKQGVVYGEVVSKDMIVDPQLVNILLPVLKTASC